MHSLLYSLYSHEVVSIMIDRSCTKTDNDGTASEILLLMSSHQSFWFRVVSLVSNWCRFLAGTMIPKSKFFFISIFTFFNFFIIFDFFPKVEHAVSECCTCLLWLSPVPPESIFLQDFSWFQTILIPCRADQESVLVPEQPGPMLALAWD